MQTWDTWMNTSATQASAVGVTGMKRLQFPDQEQELDCMPIAALPASHVEHILNLQRRI